MHLNDFFLFQLGATIGQRIGLSEKDTQKLNKMYCDAEPDHQLDSDSIDKPKKKKKNKNKPFEGHGLGYQQGKTVIIKLPKVEEYQIQGSQFSMFDYFSKTTQELQPAFIPGTGNREEVIPQLYESTVLPNIEEYEKSYFKQNPLRSGSEKQVTNREQSVIKPYTEEKREDKRSDAEYEDLSNEFYRFPQIMKPGEFSKQTQNDDNYEKQYNIEKLLFKEEESPSKYVGLSHRHLPELRSSFVPLVNKEQDSFTLFGHHTPRIEKWQHGNEFNHNYYRDRNPTLLEVYR